MTQRDRIVTLAQGLGFQHVRFASIGPTPHYESYETWIKAGLHGGMHYLERNSELRRDPRVRLPSARSCVALAMEYDHVRPIDPGGLTGKVAAYAWGRDYHNLIGKRLKKLRRALRETGIESWGGVDTAPVLERSWAAEAGLGFGGKNCVQILPARGSYMFLSVLFLDAEMEPDPVLRDHCGRCQRCLTGCPTNAFISERTLDARRCIAYWTIEDRGSIPKNLRGRFGRWFFGCDDCQEVCPHNAQPPRTAEADFHPKNAWIDLEWVLQTEDDMLMEAFIGTPLRRPGAEGLKRNACVVLGNSGKPEAIPVLKRVHDSSTPLVREHAAWALEQLGA